MWEQIGIKYSNKTIMSETDMNYITWEQIGINYSNSNVMWEQIGII